jgi:penicillin-binding protein 1B
MNRLGMVRDGELRKASEAPLGIRPQAAKPRLASYFVDYIQRVTADELGDEELYRTGYRFNTTLDPILQASAEEAVAKGLAEIEKAPLPSGETLQAALVAVDPANGEMIAMVGGRGYGTTQFNRAANSRRQPGSAFKPFVLLAAMQDTVDGKRNITLSTPVSATPISFQTERGVWTPANYDGRAYGNITVRTAIENSVNTATVRLASDVGFDEVVRTARAAGIRSRLPALPSMPLGSFEVTPVELAYAYATIASRGIRFDPFPLFSITEADGAILAEKRVHWERTIDPRAAYLATYAMEGTIERGTGRAARALGIRFPAAGKTGTTNDNRDSWFVGFTPDVVCAVWVGYDSGADTGLTGARGALRIWSRFMRSVYPEAGPVAWSPPEGVEFAEIDPESGFLVTNACPRKIREAYLTGTAPKETCPLHPVNVVVDTFRKGFRNLGDYFRNLFK